jgi:hypothetical protein
VEDEPVGFDYQQFRDADAEEIQEHLVTCITVTAKNDLVKSLQRQQKAGDWEWEAYGVLVGRYAKIGELSFVCDISGATLTKPIWKRTGHANTMYFVPLKDGWYATTDPDPSLVEAISIKDQKWSDDHKVVAFGAYTYGKAGTIEATFWPKHLHCPPESSKREWGYVIEPTIDYSDRLYGEKMVELRALKARDAVRNEDLGPISRSWITKGGWMARMVPLSHMVLTNDTETATAYIAELRAGIPIFEQECSSHRCVSSGLTHRVFYSGLHGGL